MPGDAAHLHHRLAAGESEDHCHLQEDAEEIADIVGGVFSEAFRAIATLEQETLAFRNLGQFALQLARFTGKNQRRIAGKLPLDVRQLGRIAINRQLLDR